MPYLVWLLLLLLLLYHCCYCIIVVIVLLLIWYYCCYVIIVVIALFLLLHYCGHFIIVVIVLLYCCIIDIILYWHTDEDGGLYEGANCPDWCDRSLFEDDLSASVVFDISSAEM